MSIPNLILTYTVIMLGGLAGVAVYTELRLRRFEPSQTKDRIFRCSSCGFVYTDDIDVERSRCSQCGRTNDAIQF
jgi:predicted Zn-ribbon and HTH transcriptional regulator